MTRARTNGNSRYWEHRPSDHRAGMREYWHGKLQTMPEPRTGFLARLMGRKETTNE